MERQQKLTALLSAVLSFEIWVLIFVLWQHKRLPTFRSLSGKATGYKGEQHTRRIRHTAWCMIIFRIPSTEAQRLEQSGIWNVFAKNVSIVKVFFAETFQISFCSPTSLVKTINRLQLENAKYTHANGSSYSLWFEAFIQQVFLITKKPLCL